MSSDVPTFAPLPSRTRSGSEGGMAAEHAVGSAVIVVGKGVARIVSQDATHVTVSLGDGAGEASITREEATMFLRPVVGREGARHLLARLCEPCKVARDLPVLRSLRELERASLERQVEYCRWHFRKKSALREREPLIVMTVSDMVLAELAIALDADIESVRTAVKRGRPVLEPRLVRELPPPPTLRDATFLRSFWTTGLLLVAECPEDPADAVRVAVEPGAWHAFEYEDPDEKEAPGIVILHARHGARVTTPHEVGSAGVDGGMIGALDATALSDPDFGLDEVERLRARGEGYGDRGVHCGTYGDGDHGVFVDDLRAASSVFIAF